MLIGQIAFTAIERIVHVSVESTKIIESLPSEITDE